MIKLAIWSLLIVLSCLMASPRLSGNESVTSTASSSVRIRLVSVNAVSQSFREATHAATRSIPDQVWQTIQRAGWRVQLAEFVVDAAPSLRGVRPRGWPRNLTWENSDALHLPSSRLLVVAEKRRNSSGDVVPSTRVANVLRHELGHAFDMALGGNSRFLSSTSKFVVAYNRDIDRLSESNRQRFAYYLQGSRAGWQETFAEAFAVVLGGGSNEGEPGDFKAAFPSVVEFVRKAIDNPPRPKASTRTVASPGSRRILWRR